MKKEREDREGRERGTETETGRHRGTERVKKERKERAGRGKRVKKKGKREGDRDREAQTNRVIETELGRQRRSQKDKLC